MISRFLSRARLLAALALAAVFLSGCVTDDQVRSIVRDSNYQMLLAAAPELATSGVSADGTPGTAAPDAAASLNAFLAANQDDPVLAGALRFRETLLYLNEGAFALADAAYKQVDVATLRSPRDEAIFAAYPDLRWWSEWAPAAQGVFAATQRDAAAQHMAALEKRAGTLAALPDLRDYFLEMRAWIGLKLGLASFDANTSIATLEDAVNVWTDTFAPAELELLNAASFKSVKPFDLSTRRVIRARVLLATLASQTAGAPNGQLTFHQTAVNQFFAALRH